MDSPHPTRSRALGSALFKRRVTPYCLTLTLAWSALAPLSSRAQTTPLDARVIWVEPDRVYVAASDSLWLGPGAVLRFSDRDTELARAEVVTVHRATLIEARVTIGSLNHVRRLERVRVSSERDPVRPMPVLRVGFPSHFTSHPLFECRDFVLQTSRYRADTLGSNRYRLVRDSTWAPPRPEPDTLHIRLFDKIEDEEAALERDELDVAIFWPGEASAKLRKAMAWEGGPKAFRARGVVVHRIEASPASAIQAVFADDRERLAEMNRELFLGDLIGPYLGISSLSHGRPGLAWYQVDSNCPGRTTVEEFLNRGRTPMSAPRRIHLSYLDIPTEVERNANTRGWLFTLACPVLSRPQLRPYLDSIDLPSLVNLFDCRTPGRQP